MASNERLITPVLVNLPSRSTASKGVLISKATPGSKPTIVTPKTVAVPIAATAASTKSSTKVSANIDSSNFIDDAAYQAYLAGQLATLINTTTVNILSIFGNLTVSDVGSFYNNSVISANTLIITNSLYNINKTFIPTILSNIYVGNTIDRPNLYNFLNIIFPQVKSNTNLFISNLFSNTQIQENIVGNTEYKSFVEIVNGNLISNIANNLTTYNYITKAENIYINGNISNDNLFGMLDLLYPSVKSNVNSNILSTIQNYSENLLTPFYTPVVSNIDINTINSIVSNTSLYTYMHTNANVYINGNISNDGLYDMLHLLYPNVKGNVNTNLISTITLYSGNILSPYYSELSSNINSNILNNLVSNVSLYNYMKINANVYINGNISNDGLYGIMDFLYPSIKSNITNNLLSNIKNYSANLLSPSYTNVVANIDQSILNNLVSNVSMYDYIKKNANVYINGNINNNGFYTLMDLLYPVVKSNINANLLSIIQNYSSNLLSPHYTRFVENIDANTINNLSANVSIYDYMQKNAKIYYIDGNINNDGLYRVTDLLYPSVKSNINANLLTTINNYSANILTPDYSVLVANINGLVLNNVVENANLYDYMQINSNVYINGNINNGNINDDGLYSIIDLLYPSVKSNVDNKLISIMNNYVGNVLTPYYSLVVANIDNVKLSNLVGNVSIYNYMQKNENIYINGIISNDNLYHLLDFLYPSVKSNVDANLLTTIISTTDNLLKPHYSDFIANINSNTLVTITNSLSPYTYMKNTANIYINGNLSNNGLYRVMDLLYPIVKSTIDSYLLSTITASKDTLLTPIYTPFIANIDNNVINNLLNTLDLYTYMQNNANIYINGNIDNIIPQGLYEMMDFLFDNNTIISTFKNYSGNLLSPYYTPFTSNISVEIISNLVAKINLSNYLQNKENLFINGFINVNGLYNMANLLYPDVKSDVDTKLLDTITNYSGNLLMPYYTPFVSNIDLITLNNLTTDQPLYNYMQNNANIYINGSISNEGLYKMMNLLYPIVKSTEDSRLLLIIESYKDTLLSPTYTPFIANINANILNQLLDGLSIYTYIQNSANIYINENGNIQSDSLYNMMDFLFDTNTLLSTIKNYNDNILSPYYTTSAQNININEIGNLVSNIGIQKYIQNKANIYINGIIQNEGLYQFVDVLYPNVKTNVNNELLSTIINFSGNLLLPYYSPVVSNINIHDLGNIVNGQSLYTYMKKTANVNINGNVSNDGLYNVLDLLYPNVKANVNNVLISTINNYSGNVLSPYYTSTVANINSSLLNTVINNVSLYNYMQKNANVYIDGNISYDGLYYVMDFIYPSVKSNVSRELLTTIYNYSGNILSPFYSAFIQDIDVNKLDNLSSTISPYIYLQNNANVYINGNINNDGLYRMMDLLEPFVKSTIDSQLVLTITQFKNTLLRPSYTSFIANIDETNISNITYNVNMYTYMNESTNIYINGNLSNVSYDGLYKNMDLLFPNVKTSIDAQLLTTLKTVNPDLIGNTFANLTANIDGDILNNLISNVSLYNYINYNYNLYVNGTLDVDKLNNVLNLLYFNANVKNNIKNIINQVRYNLKLGKNTL